MIHNDLKGNNMLISSLTGRISLIDFGVCKPYNTRSDTAPYSERSREKIGPWFAYPPEYNFLTGRGRLFNRPTDIESILSNYDENKAWSYNPVLHTQPGETAPNRVLRILAILEKVYNEYFNDLDVIDLVHLSHFTNLTTLIFSSLGVSLISSFFGGVSTGVISCSVCCFLLGGARLGFICSCVGVSSFVVIGSPSSLTFRL
jgi:serine/threonine protein kinase